MDRILLGDEATHEFLAFRMLHSAISACTRSSTLAFRHLDWWQASVNRFAFITNISNAIIALLQRRFRRTKPIAAILALAHTLVAQDDLAIITLTKAHTVPTFAPATTRALVFSFTLVADVRVTFVTRTPI